ncbi:cupin domain-containing protein [Rhodopseudomonas palustris]|jgi:quercetin dioxygenase-like cupin family protein|uniref:cupin domain-containing protein n=1 Tax=Rhodopseudomonas palustris TaxID=1076 RepID=UPI0006422E80|nr:cupin domain-containing protein [Rhodopseudomonas palustris]QDL96495.1 cupin domain-containing protein [Rhodopseudomonas palustris]
MTIRISRHILVACALVAACGAAVAQQSGIKRTPLQKIEFPDGYVTVSGLAELPPGGNIGRHTHPGIETGYLLEGEAVMSIDGEPDKHLKAGDSYVIPAGVVHDAKVHGDKGAKVMAVWVVDKTKPLATPAK